MAGAHRQCADRYGVSLSDPAVGYHAAEERREVDKPRVESENQRSQGDGREWSHKPLNGSAKPCESGNVLDMPRQEELVHQVENQQRHHSIKRKTLPSLCERKKEESFGMAEQQSIDYKGMGLRVSDDAPLLREQENDSTSLLAGRVPRTTRQQRSRAWRGQLDGKRATAVVHWRVPSPDRGHEGRRSAVCPISYGGIERRISGVTVLWGAP